MKRFLFSKKGTILLITFILVFILTSFSTALFFPSSTRASAVQFDYERLRSLNIADAGMANALYNLQKGNPATLGSDVSPLSFDHGTYYTLIQENVPAPDLHTIYAIGRFKRAVSTVRATVSYTIGLPATGKYKPESAIIAGGILRIMGNAKISGSKGSLRSNKKIALLGSPNIAQDVKASENIRKIGLPIIGGDEESWIEPEPIPTIEVEEYEGEANYVLRNDGKVYDKDGTLIHDTAVDGSFQNWIYNGVNLEGVATWDYESDIGINGMYYIEGHVSIPKSPGSLVSPWEVLIIATGHIDVSGNPNIAPIHPDNVVMIAGTDLKLKGDSNTTYEGFYAAQEQLRIGGSPTITGSIFVQDSGNSDPLVPGPGSTITGSPNIIFGGGLEVFLGDDLKKVEIISTDIKYSKK